MNNDDACIFVVYHLSQVVYENLEANNEIESVANFRIFKSWLFSVVLNCVMYCFCAAVEAASGKRPSLADLGRLSTNDGNVVARSFACCNKRSIAFAFYSKNQRHGLNK